MPDQFLETSQAGKEDVPIFHRHLSMPISAQQGEHEVSEGISCFMMPSTTKIFLWPQKIANFETK